MFCYVVLDIHTKIANRYLWPCRIDTKGPFGAVKAQTKNKDQSQLVVVVELAELRQVVYQQAELIQKQVEEAREREEELICRQNQLFEAFVQGVPFSQGGNRPGPVVEYVRQIDHLSRYAPDMVYTKTWKNMSTGWQWSKKKYFKQVHFR